jgi:Na+-translocating ferredoxin:NAD+ oxidoreductase RnfE subunit
MEIIKKNVNNARLALWVMIISTVVFSAGLLMNVANFNSTYNAIGVVFVGLGGLCLVGGYAVRRMSKSKKVEGWVD